MHPAHHSKRICVIGTGYVGMATVIGLASLGWSVVGHDIATERIERLKRGIAPYREQGVDEALRMYLDQRLISFTDSLALAARDADTVIIAVGTPARDDGSADLSSLEAVIGQLGGLGMTTSPTLVIRSTVPPGTSDRLARTVQAWAQVVYAPEFLREGSAIADFLEPHRIVIGAETTSVAVPYVRLFEVLQVPVLFTSRCNAELIKTCSNAFLALKISFANEVANLCDGVGADVDDVLRGIAYDRRIGADFLRPGLGFGGPCLEKDVRSIHHAASSAGVDAQLFAATLRVNDAQPRRVLSLLEQSLGDLSNACVGVWGLSFKAGTDDMRDSLAMRVVNELSRRGATSIVYDPAVRVAPLPRGSHLVTSALEAADADALLVLTDWPEFARVSVPNVAVRLKRRLIVDGRNVLDGERYAAAGIHYQGVGRPASRRHVAVTPATEAV